jgi:predicted nucleotidyltransferase
MEGAIKTTEQVLSELTRQKPVLSERFKVRSMALFGSYARGDQTETSDVDILVEVDPAIGLEFVTLADTLESALGLPVELVSTRALSSRARDYIASELIRV